MPTFFSSYCYSDNVKRAPINFFLLLVVLVVVVVVLLVLVVVVVFVLLVLVVAFVLLLFPLLGINHSSFYVSPQGLFYPPHVGLPIGSSDSPKNFLLETHYDNPKLVKGLSIL